MTHRHRNELAKLCSFRIIIWVPSYSNIPSNCKADELARHGAIIQLPEEFATVCILLGTYHGLCQR